MAKPVYGRFSAPGSLAQLTRGRGFSSELVGFLLPFARQDFCYIEDDFLSDTLDGTLWDLSTDAGSTAFAAGALENGSLRGATQNTTGDYIQIRFARTAFDAARNPGAEVRWKADVVVNYKQEFAFCDPPTSEAVAAVNSIDTPSFNAGVTDVVSIVRDTGATLTTYGLCTVGTTDAATKANFVATQIPTANVYFRQLVQVADGASYGVLDNEFQNHAKMALGPDTGVLMRPHFIIGTLANAAITVDIDYIRIWSERN